MSTFKDVALTYFRDEVGPHYMQRIDGVACFSPLPKFWFWRIRLEILVWRGLLKKRGLGSFWPSCNGMPGYGTVQD